jgi:hypothetical protein
MSPLACIYSGCSPRLVASLRTAWRSRRKSDLTLTWHCDVPPEHSRPHARCEPPCQPLRDALCLPCGPSPACRPAASCGRASPPAAFPVSSPSAAPASWLHATRPASPERTERAATRSRMAVTAQPHTHLKHAQEMRPRCARHAALDGAPSKHQLYSHTIQERAAGIRALWLFEAMPVVQHHLMHAWNLFGLSYQTCIVRWHSPTSRPWSACSSRRARILALQRTPADRSSAPHCRSGGCGN